MAIYLRFLDSPESIALVEELQRQVWTGDETEILPAHIIIAAIHHGGILIGALDEEHSAGEDALVGFVFGFPGMYSTPDGPRLLHISHMMGVLPEYRDQGVGFSLKRAQWQMVRRQGIDRITWTYDPLQSRNGNLNIAKLGAVCNTYRENYYGEMRDGLNIGVASDRFQVDWWVNSRRVERRLSRRARPALDLAHYHAAGVAIVNSSRVGISGWAEPAERVDENYVEPPNDKLVLVEIPAKFPELKASEPDLAVAWRNHTRQLFSEFFASGYLVTDFVYLPGSHPRSFYVLSHGESTL